MTSKAQVIFPCLLPSSSLPLPPGPFSWIDVGQASQGNSHDEYDRSKDFLQESDFTDLHEELGNEGLERGAGASEKVGKSLTGLPKVLAKQET